MSLNLLERRKYNKVHCSNIDNPFYSVEPNEIKAKSKLLDFLSITQLPDRYKQINDVYVAPKNYEEIKEILRKNKIVFITGSGESGQSRQWDLNLASKWVQLHVVQTCTVQHTKHYQVMFN